MLAHWTLSGVAVVITGGPSMAVSFSIGVRPWRAIEKRSWLYRYSQAARSPVATSKSCPPYRCQIPRHRCDGTFDLAVLLRPPRLDVADAHAEALARQREGERKVGAVVDLNLSDRERKRVGELRRNARLERWFCRRYSRSTRRRVQSSIAVY